MISPYLQVNNLATRYTVTRVVENSTRATVLSEAQPTPPDGVWLEFSEIPATITPEVRDMKDGDTLGVIQRFINRRMVESGTGRYVLDELTAEEKAAGMTVTTLAGIIPGTILRGVYYPVVVDAKTTSIPYAGKNPWFVSSHEGYLCFPLGLPTGTVLPLSISFYKYVGRDARYANIVERSMIPTNTVAIDLGDATHSWKDIHVSNWAYIHEAKIEENIDTKDPLITVGAGATEDSQATGLLFASTSDEKEKNAAIVRYPGDEGIKFIADTTESILASAPAALGRADIEAKGIAAESVRLSAGTEQLFLGTSGAGSRISAASNTETRTYTLPASTEATPSILTSVGTQSRSGATTFGSTITSAGGELRIGTKDETHGRIIVSVPPIVGEVDKKIVIPEPVADAALLLSETADAATPQVVSSAMKLSGAVSVPAALGFAFGTTLGQKIAIAAADPVAAVSATIPDVGADSDVVTTGEATSEIKGTRRLTGIVELSNTAAAALTAIGGVAVVKDIVVSESSIIGAGTTAKACLLGEEFTDPVNVAAMPEDTADPLTFPGPLFVGPVYDYDSGDLVPDRLGVCIRGSNIHFDVSVPAAPGVVNLTIGMYVALAWTILTSDDYIDTTDGFSRSGYIRITNQYLLDHWSNWGGYYYIYIYGNTNLGAVRVNSVTRKTLLDAHKSIGVDGTLTFSIPDSGTSGGLLIQKSVSDDTTLLPRVQISDRNLKLYKGDATESIASVALAPATVSQVRTVTFPDAGADSKLVLTAGNQTISGTKRFDSPLVLASSALSIAADGTQDGKASTIQCAAQDAGSTRTITIADTPGDAEFISSAADATFENKITLSNTDSAALSVSGGVSAGGFRIAAAGTVIVDHDDSDVTVGDKIVMYRDGTNSAVRTGIASNTSAMSLVSASGPIMFEAGAGTIAQFAADRSGITLVTAGAGNVAIGYSSAAATDAVVRINDSGQDTKFVLDNGTATFSAAVQFNSAPVLTTKSIVFGTTAGTKTTIIAPDQATASTLSIPAITGASSATIWTLAGTDAISGDKTFDGISITDIGTDGVILGTTAASSTKLIAATHSVPDTIATVTIQDSADDGYLVTTDDTQSITSSKTFEDEPIIVASTSAYLTFGTSNALSISSAQTASVTVTIPALSGTGGVIMTREAAQTRSGIDTFTATPVLAMSQNQLVFGTAAGELTTISCPAQTQASTISLPVLAGGYSSGSLACYTRTILTGDWKAGTVVTGTGSVIYDKSSDGTITLVIGCYSGTLASDGTAAILFRRAIPAASSTSAHSLKVWSVDSGVTTSGTAFMSTDGVLSIWRDAAATGIFPAGNFGWWTNKIPYSWSGSTFVRPRWFLHEDFSANTIPGYAFDRTRGFYISHPTRWRSIYIRVTTPVAGPSPTLINMRLSGGVITLASPTHMTGNTTLRQTGYLYFTNQTTLDDWIGEPDVYPTKTNYTLYIWYNSAYNVSYRVYYDELLIEPI